MENGIQNIRRWAYSYAETYKAMPPRQDMDAMASANGVANIVVFTMMQSALSEMEDRELGISSLEELEGIGEAI